MDMPRTAREIIEQAEQLADLFERHQPGEGAVVDAKELAAVRSAFLARAAAEHDLADSVAVARAAGHSWNAIGAMLGTSGEAARQRYR